MDGGDIEQLMRRIDLAMARIDSAFRDSRESARAGDAALQASNDRLRAAVSGAIRQIDALLPLAEPPA